MIFPPNLKSQDRGGLAKFRKPLKVERCERDFQPLTIADRRYNMVVEAKGKNRPLAETGDISDPDTGGFEIKWLRWK